MKKCLVYTGLTLIERQKRMWIGPLPTAVKFAKFCDPDDVAEVVEQALAVDPLVCCVTVDFDHPDDLAKLVHCGLIGQINMGARSAK